MHKRAFICLFGVWQLGASYTLIDVINRAYALQAHLLNQSGTVQTLSIPLNSDTIQPISAATSTLKLASVTNQTFSPAWMSVIPALLQYYSGGSCPQNTGTNNQADTSENCTSIQQLICASAANTCFISSSVLSVGGSGAWSLFAGITTSTTAYRQAVTINPNGGVSSTVTNISVPYTYAGSNTITATPADYAAAVLNLEAVENTFPNPSSPLLVDTATYSTFVNALNASSYQAPDGSIYYYANPGACPDGSAPSANSTYPDSNGWLWAASCGRQNITMTAGSSKYTIGSNAYTLPNNMFYASCPAGWTQLGGPVSFTLPNTTAPVYTLVQCQSSSGSQSAPAVTTQTTTSAPVVTTASSGSASTDTPAAVYIFDVHSKFGKDALAAHAKAGKLCNLGAISEQDTQGQVYQGIVCAAEMRHVPCVSVKDEKECLFWAQPTPAQGSVGPYPLGDNGQFMPSKGAETYQAAGSTLFKGNESSRPTKSSAQQKEYK